MVPSPRRIVVAGTGTNVGKTVFTAALVADAIASGVDAIAVKPVETGPAAEADSVQLAAASRRRVEPYFRFPAPVSPHLAARRAGQSLDPTALARWVRSVGGAETVIVETAGGLFSPLSERAANADWIALVDWAAHVLVCPGRLGVLHDVAATLAAAPSIPWSLLVVSAVEGQDEAALQAAEIERAVLPRLSRTIPVRVFAAVDRPWAWVASALG
jgi:dethiobiotin synthase